MARPLTPEYAERDHAAYTASPDVIAAHSDGRWPVEGFTLADDRDLIEVHRADHEARRAFSFLLLEPDEREAVGCLYLNPLRDYLERAGAGRTLLVRTAAAAMVTFWTRQDLQGTGLSGRVAGAVDTWVREEWPLDAHLFRVLPGETESCAALAGLGLERVEPDLPSEHRPYLWFGRI